MQNWKVLIPERFNFGYDVVDEYARTHPDKLALLWVDDHGNEKRFTFADIKRYSDKAANAFKKHGVKKGDVVMMMLMRRYEYWFCIPALCKIGAIAIPATHLLTDKDISYRIDAADVSFLLSVHKPELLEYINKAEQCVKKPFKKATLGAYDGFIDFSAELEAASDIWDMPAEQDMPDNGDPMLIYFSSGTTGMPKMALHDFTYPLGQILTATEWHNVTQDGLHLTVADTGWAKAGWGKTYGQWIAGSAQFVYDMEKFEPLRLAEMVCKHRVTTFCAPPTIYRFLIKEDLSGLDFSALRYCTVAGEPLNPEVFNQFKRITGIEIKEGFGQSETTPLIGTFTFMKAVPGSIGMPSPQYEVELLNENDEPCEVGEEGEVCICTKNGRPVGMFRGYYKDEALTKSVWYDGYYRLGDIAWRDENGYYWFVGRRDDVIKSSGYRIGPFEVESALLEHPAVLECAISAIPDPDRGQIVKATVVLTKNYSPSNELVRELQQHVKKTTAPYKYPRIVEFVEELPKTVSGKIRRKQIREEDEQRYKG